MSSEELISRRTRSAFRDHCSDFSVVRQIERAFENEGFDPAPDSDAPEGGWYADGQRRGTFDRYTAAVDWSDPAEVRTVLDVFEELLSWCPDNEYGIPQREQLTRHLRRDGFSIDADPALAISGAKALIEAATKLVLIELEESVDERADLPALVKSAQNALKLHPETLVPTAAGRETVIRILSNLSQLAIGVAELRNEYGPDHGRSRPTVGLGPRHAHLAVGAASTYVRMLLETLEARRSTAKRVSVSSK